MDKNKAVTYSLLAHINNSGVLMNGTLDIFIPLVKRVLSKLNTDGVFSGKSLLEIKTVADVMYSVDFPIPVIKTILEQVSREINTEEVTHFQLYGDGAFALHNYSFTEYEDAIAKQKNEVNNIETLFKEFCETSDIKIDSSLSIFDFLEKNKISLSKYLSDNKIVDQKDYSAEAQFVDFFRKIPQVYDTIKDIYLGSIIAGYIEFKVSKPEDDVLLLLDTNFVIGLLDLNTEESAHTCNTLLKIALQQGYKAKVLEITIDEIKGLLEAKAAHFDKSFLQTKVNPEDIYNACDRRKLTRTDLERIADNIERLLGELGIGIIYDCDKLTKEASFTEDYKKLKDIRSSHKSALHDAAAILYVRKKRGANNIKDFEKVNAWFVNNTINKESQKSIETQNRFQPEKIKADDLLNIMWLSNPQVHESMSALDLVEIGLTSSVSLTLHSDLPRSKVLKELDDNIHKYAKDNVSDRDILRVATRITNKQLKDIETLNELAKKDKGEFVARLEEEAERQKRVESQRIAKLEEVFKEISLRTEELEQSKKEFEEKAERIIALEQEKQNTEDKVKQLEAEIEKRDKKEEERLRKEKEEKDKIEAERMQKAVAALKVKQVEWVNSQVKKWRLKTWIEFGIGLVFIALGVLYILFRAGWDMELAKQTIKIFNGDVVFGSLISLGSTVFFGFTVKSLYDKYRNHSNIENYKKGLNIPETFD